MLNKKALIVDDSKLALFVLKKMLVEQGLGVDTAQSAEECLGYLVHNKPDIIFMDHTMPGMDGLEALEIIKDNPDTQNIPVMMYTSKEDEAYLSRARAAGAVDILPKQLKPTDLYKALQKFSLHTNLDETEIPVANEDMMHSSVLADPVQDESAELSQLVRDAEVALEKETLKQFVNQELERHYNRYTNILKRVNQRLELLILDSKENLANILEADRKILSRTSSLMRPLILFLGFFVLGYLYFDLNRSVTSLEQRMVSLNNAYEENIPWDLDNQLSANSADSAAVDIRGLLDALEESINVNNMVPYDSTLLGDNIGQKILNLILPLNTANYSGIVQITAHVGKFCFVSNSNGQFVLPAKDTLFSTCQVLEPDINIEKIADPKFLQLIKEINESNDNSFTIALEVNQDPNKLTLYPEPSSTLRALEWNQVAQKNHRVEFAFR